MSDINKDKAGPEPASQKAIRLWPAIFTLVVGVSLLVATQVGKLTATGKPVLDFFIVAGGINSLLYLWLRIWSKLNIRWQTIFAAAILLAQFSLFAAFRLDGFDGNGRFIARWRWSKTPEQLLSEFSGTTSERVDVDLSSNGPRDSPAFRGSQRDGRYRSGAQLDWSQGIKEIWRRPLGRGWSSFATSGEFAVTQEQIGDHECVSCFELASGDLVWRHRIESHFYEVTSGAGPRATPSISDSKVFALSATGIMVCIDGKDGAEIWRRQLCHDSSEHILFGFSASPLVHNDRVYVAIGAPNQSLYCLEINSGKTLWSRGDENQDTVHLSS